MADPASRRERAITSLTMLPHCPRLSLRVSMPDAAGAAQALGGNLPAACSSTILRDDIVTLWLGPDEWLLLGRPDRDPHSALAASLASLTHSLVDVSHRYRAFEIIGPACASMLATGCALDLRDRAFPVGRCARTLFHAAEIILWRSHDDAFRIELGRSFAPYVEALLGETAQEYR